MPKVRGQLTFETYNPKRELILSKLRPALAERSKKRIRDVFKNPITSGYIVAGRPFLGDEYPAYYVEKIDGKTHCTCQDHPGGEHRKQCSHKGAVLLSTCSPLRISGRPLPTHVWEDLAEKKAEQNREKREKKPERSVIQQVSESLRRSSPSSKPLPSPSSFILASRFGRIHILEEDEEKGVIRYQVEGETHALRLPSWTKKARSSQLQAAIDTVDAFLEGYKIVISQLPTGFGKTLYAWLVHRILAKPAVYTCTTKSLQDQAQKDFLEARTLKGKANYPTELYGFKYRGLYGGKAADISCEDCEITLGEEECTFCRSKYSCPYRKAKHEMMQAPIGILNTAAYLSHQHKSPENIFEKHPLVIYDEGDELESALLSFVECEISNRRLKQWGLELPKKTKPEDWSRWLLEEVMPKVKTELRAIHSNTKLDRVERERKKRPLQRLYERLSSVASECEEGWVFDGYQDKDRTGKPIPKALFKPIKVDKLGPLLFAEPRHVVIMSATVISHEHFAAELGIKESEFYPIDYPSSFPAERRPISLDYVGRITFKTEAQLFPKLVLRIDEICKQWEGHRILIHTVSFKRTRELLFGRTIRGKEYKLSNEVVGRCITYSKAKDREAALDLYKNTPGAILLAPSFARGIDLKHDLCRVQILCKVPYKNTSDKQVNARIWPKTTAGQLWYSLETIRTIVQMTGRGMRTPSDFCQTYILDECFSQLYGARYRKFFPSWWRESVVRRGGIQNLSPSSLPERKEGQ